LRNQLIIGFQLALLWSTKSSFSLQRLRAFSPLRLRNVSTVIGMASRWARILEPFQEPRAVRGLFDEVSNHPLGQRRTVGLTGHPWAFQVPKISKRRGQASG
jgi:hypothetical protein